MENKKNRLTFLVSALIAAGTVAGCGGGDEPILAGTPIVYQGTVYYPGAPQPTDCCCEEDGTPITTPDASKTPAPAKTAVPNKTPGKTPEPTKTTAPAPAAPADEKAKGRKILDKVLATITTPNAIEVEADKWEKGIGEDKRVVTQTFKVYNKKPGKVKIDVLYHSKASSIGAKLIFNVGTGKATVRPGGALSFITKEMDQTDANLITPNGFTPEQIDFFYISKRLGSPSYNAELTGKTTINGSEVYLLKITKNGGANELSPIIKHEIMAFDIKTFEVKSWELFSASNESFFKITIKSFKALSDLPDSTFKL